MLVIKKNWQGGSRFVEPEFSILEKNKKVEMCMFPGVQHIHTDYILPVTVVHLFEGDSSGFCATTILKDNDGIREWGCF